MGNAAEKLKFTGAVEEKQQADYQQFSDVLKNIRKGECLLDASEKMAELVKAIRDTGKGGKFVIELTILPLSNVSETVNIVDKISIKKPEKPKGGSIFYTTDSNSLERNDPNQGEFSELSDDFKA